MSESNNAYLEQLQKEMLDYQKNEKKSGRSNNRKTKEEILAKYFVPRNDRETFRILPPQGNATKPITEAYFHVASLNSSGGKKQHGKVLYCQASNDPLVPKKDAQGNIITDQEGKPVMIPPHCPLCAKNKALLKTQVRDDRLKGKKRDDLTPELQVIFDRNREIFNKANKWAAKKFYIIRGIDQGKQKDGVKFWRFKKNFRNQGTFDKLIPVLHQFIEEHQSAYFDVEKGSDISITMTDAEFNGRAYKDISAIICKSPSKLHPDEFVAKQWLDDPITWRDVFKPKAAPNVTPYEFLEMVSMGQDPYWDDSDSNNKRWVYPGRPDLEEKANQRFSSNDSDEESNYGSSTRASDADTGIGITSVTNQHVGDFQNAGVPNAVDATAGLGDTGQPQAEPQQTTQAETQTTTQEPTNTVDTQESATDIGGDDYEDLPF